MNGIKQAHIEELEAQLEALRHRFHTREEEDEINEELDFWRNYNVPETD